MIKIGLTILGALIGIELHRFAPTTPSNEDGELTRSAVS